MAISFLYPWLLLSLPVAFCALVYAYRRRGTGERITVGTIFLLRALQRQSSARRKFTPPLRFYFELLLLSLLAAAAAGIFLRGGSKSIAILIDNSLSMGAHDRGNGGATLLAQALSAAEDTIELSPASTQIQLYVSSPSLREVGSDLSPRAATDTLQRGIELAYAADNLEAALARLAADASFDQVVVFTDKREERANSSAKNSVQVKTVGGEEHRSNVSIGQIILGANENPGFSLANQYTPGGTTNTARTNCKGRSCPFQCVLSQPEMDSKPGNLIGGQYSYSSGSTAPNSVSIKVTLRSFVPEMVSITVLLESFTEMLSSPTLIEEKVIPLTAHATAEVTFEHVPTQVSTFRVRLQTSAGTVPYDTLQEDNVAWLTAETHGQNMLLVGQLSVHELGLDRVATFKFQHVEGTQYERAVSEKEDFWSAASSPQAAIFHRYVPTDFPPTNALFVLPPAKNPLFTVHDKVTGVSLTRWIPTHPLLRYLNLPVLVLKELQPVECPPWAHTLLGTSAGNAAVVGSLGGKRYAILGFEMFPFEGKSAPLLSIFTLNILKWLTDVEINLGYQSTYARYVPTLPEATVGYLGERELLVPLEEPKDTYVLPKPGILAISSQSSKVTQKVAVNYFDENESDTFRTKRVTTPQGLPNSAVAQRAGRVGPTLTSKIALIVLVLILADLIIAIVRLLSRKGGIGVEGINYGSST